MSCGKSQFGKLVSLMELLELNAEAFCRASMIIGQAWMLISRGDDVTTNAAGTIGGIVGELQRECERLELPSAVAQIGRIRQWLDSASDRNLGIFSQMLVELQNRLVDDLKRRIFLAVPEQHEALYKQGQPLFGDGVEKKFPRMSEDISEAGKCIALNRNTAGVFHLMRVMELAVQSFGGELGVKVASEQNWQVILDQINAAIRKRDTKQANTKRYAEAASHLYNVKIAWRNEVMHPKQTYTDEEARAIFGNVRTFVGDLAGLI